MLGEEVPLLRGVLLPDVAPPVTLPIVAIRFAIAAVAATAGTTGAAATSTAASSTLAAAHTTATALGALVTAATTSSLTSPAAASARKERLLGWPRRPLRPLLLGQGGVSRTGHTDNLCPVAIIRRLQHRLDMTILIRQRAKKTCMQEGVRDSHPLLNFGYSCLLVYAVTQWGCCWGEW